MTDPEQTPQLLTEIDRELHHRYFSGRHMTIQIQRGRQFVGSAEPLPLFDGQGQVGGWWAAVAKKLVDSGLHLTLRDAATGEPVALKTQADWDAFLAANLSTKAQAEDFVTRFGIQLQDFAELVDDAAMSSETGRELNLSPNSMLSEALSLNRTRDDYGSKVSAASAVDLGSGLSATTQGSPAIGPSILDSSVSASWDRDRAEQESWADFRLRDGGTRIFRDNTGPAPYAKLTEPKWNDPEAMALVEAFNLPVHVESRMGTNGIPELQDHNEMFRETYFDDAQNTLRRTGASVRARVRFDDDPPFTVRRVLVQAKEGREVDPATGRSSVRKFEKRWEGNSRSEEQAQQALVSGTDNGEVMAVSQKLYTLAKEAGTLPEDENLRLRPTHLVLQRRRRTHMQLESLARVTARRESLKQEVVSLQALNQPVPDEMIKFLAKLDQQIATMTEMTNLLSKYGQWLATGEAFIVSADRYNVYDPSARAAPPQDLDDEAGRLGRGLHLEAEWDSNSSDSFERAIKQIDQQLEANPPNAAELQADREKLEGFRELFRQDVAKTVEIGRNVLVKAGLEEDPEKKSKDDRAADIVANAAARPTYWL